ncbi:MAG: LysO family transporter [Clostridiales bacterium]|nr:LysO family transporter [Clostridiales bacterium]
MNMVFLCFTIGILGFIVGRKAIPKDKDLKWIDKLLMVLVVALLFILGAEIGSDENIVSSIGSIGLVSLTLAVFALAGSAAMVTVARKALGIDKRGKKSR